MDPVMRIVTRKMKDQPTDKTVKMDTKNMHGTPERVGAEMKMKHRTMKMGCK
jgi:hypothetical protein